MTILRPAAKAGEASWLLEPASDWRDLVRFGPSGYEVYLRVGYEAQGATDGETDDETDGETGTMRQVLALLERHTSTPESAYVAVWEGWIDQKAPDAPHVSIPNREMLLFTGPVSVTRDAPALAWGLQCGFGDAEPHLVWPADRAWLLASEVDEEIEFTVGCSAPAAQALLTAPGVGARVAIYGEDTPLHRE